MRLKLVVETPRGNRETVEGDVTAHGQGNKYLETDDGRGFKLYEDGRIMEVRKYGLVGSVVEGTQLSA